MINDRGFGFPILILTALISMGMGFLIFGVLQHQQDAGYEEASVQTCLYANNLTGLVNGQSEMLEVFMRLPEGNLTRLDKLNCSYLEGE